MQQAQLAETVDPEGDLVDGRAEQRIHRVRRDVRGLPRSQHDLVMIVGIAREEDELEAEGLPSVGDGEPHDITVEALHRLDVLDAQTEVTESQPRWPLRCHRCRRR